MYVRYVVLLRGINVGGKNKIKMQDLREQMEEIGLTDVKTYIQSGNLLCSSDLDPASLKRAVEVVLESHFGMRVRVLVRTVVEFVKVIEHLPFTSEEVAQVEAAEPEAVHLYVYFLDEAPLPEQIARLEAGVVGQDQVRAGQREIYLLCETSIRFSKVAARVPRVFSEATARNWKTVLKIKELA